jgi:hypothetical protein
MTRRSSALRVILTGKILHELRGHAEWAFEMAVAAVPQGTPSALV